MSLEKILQRIREDAEGEAEKIIAESRRKAEEIKENARREAEELSEALKKEVGREAELEANRLVTQARLEGKLKLLSRKKELIERVLESAFQGVDLIQEGLKKEIILKQGRREESFDQEKLKDELRPLLESDIVEVLDI